jgi:glycopeptide antibiotics resistance protein
VDPWEWPAYVGIVWGLVLFVVSLLPILVVQYRRYGDLSGPRLLGACGLSIYIVALFAYTMLPAPVRSTQWCLDHDGGPTWQLVPFSTFFDAGEATAGLGLRETVLSRAWLQIIFNVVLFVPLGIWCRRFFEHGILAATAIGLGVSILIETTQATANWGLWPCPYRYASVDDVITNTAGALLGASIAWLVLFWMPQSSRLERARLSPRRVTVFRRWLGMLLDVTIVVVGIVATAIAVRVAILATGHPEPVEVRAAEALIAYGLPLLLLVYLPELVGHGGSIGQRLVWLRPSWRGEPTIARRLARATVSPGLTIGLLMVAATGPARLRDPALLAALALITVSVLAVPVTSTRRGLSGLVSASDLVDSRADDHASSSGAPGRDRSEVGP